MKKSFLVGFVLIISTAAGLADGDVIVEEDNHHHHMHVRILDPDGSDN